MSRRQEVFAIHAPTHRLFVNTKYSGIPPLAFLTDGLPTVTFSDDPNGQYIDIDTLIAWYENEVRATNGHGGSAAYLAELTRIVTDFRARRSEYEQ